MYSHHSANGSNTAGTPEYKLNEVLVEIDGWRLVKPLYPALLECKSYVVHIDCCGLVKDVSAATVQKAKGQVNKECVRCGLVPPSELLGLEILHNGKI